MNQILNNTIATHFTFSSDGTVRTYLEYLEDKGYIQRHGKARSIRVLRSTSNTPVLGRIKAGNPAESFEYIDGNIQEMDLFRSVKNRFALKVSGDSMIDAGIYDGDVAVIDQEETVISGNIVAVSVEDEATLKFFKQLDDGIYLIPANNDYKAIKLDAYKDTRVLGKCIGITRSYS